MLSSAAEQKNVDRTGVLTPRAEIRQENRAKTFLSQETNMKLFLEKVHKAVRFENSTGVISEIKSYFGIICLGLNTLYSGLPCSLGARRGIWGVAADSYCVSQKSQREKTEISLKSKKDTSEE